MRLDAALREDALCALSRACGVESMEFGADWSVMAVVDGTDVIGAVLIRGPESHIGVVRTCFLRPILREVLGGQLSQFGRAVTTVRAAHWDGRRFVERLGFRLTHEVDGIVHYEMKGMRHA